MMEQKDEITLWNTKELMRQTGMSWNTITEQFFYNADFKKYKVGRKWYFPAEETREYLTNWLKEQKR